MLATPNIAQYCVDLILDNFGDETSIYISLDELVTCSLTYFWKHLHINPPIVQILLEIENVGNIDLFSREKISSIPNFCL